MDRIIYSSKNSNPDYGSRPKRLWNDKE
jgi:hypothetical protein